VEPLRSAETLEATAGHLRSGDAFRRAPSDVGAKPVLLAGDEVGGGVISGAVEILAELFGRRGDVGTSPLQPRNGGRYPSARVEVISLANIRTMVDAYRSAPSVLSDTDLAALAVKVNPGPQHRGQARSVLSSNKLRGSAVQVSRSG
jgi:hypothetical protein